MSYKILVIDHDATNVERIQRPLAEAGYEVVVATGAEEGIQTLERVQPDLAVIEALLPEKNGSELCQQIKESPLGKTMPVIIMLEADEEAQNEAKAMDLHGCDMLIDRSIQDEELLGLCQQLFEDQKVVAETAEEPAVEQEAPEPEQPSVQSDMLLDTYELDGALQKLDSIIEEQPDGQAAEAHEAAERAGDFSHIAEELGGRSAGQSEPEQVADSGEDIDFQLDSVLSMGTSSEPAPTETEAPVALYEEIEATPEAQEEQLAEPEVVVEEESVEEKPLDQVVAEALETEKAVQEPAVYPARSIPFPAPMPEREQEPSLLKKYWWVAAAALAVVLVGAGLMLMPGESESEPLVASLTSESAPPAGESDTAGASLVSAPVPAPTEEVEQEPVSDPPVIETPPAPKPVKVERPVAKPKPRRVTPKPEPKPVVVKAEPKPEPVVAKPAPVVAKIEPKPEPKPEPVVAKTEPVVTKPEPKPEPVKVTPPPPVKIAPAPVQVEQPPAEPVFEPPVVLNRVEPVYPRKALKRASGGTIILKLLISESGRIIRVTVDQGAPVPELEAATVNAVLRWRYRPATEDGTPVKAWTTAEFSF